MMKTISRIVQISVVLVAAFSVSTAMACTTSLWNGGATGAPLDGDPATALPRVSGVCAMNLTAAGSVQDNSPANESQAFIRFYVKATLASPTTIFEAFSDEASVDSLIKITFDGDDFTFDADAGTGASGPVAGKPGWNMIEIAWVSGGIMKFWVNRDAIVEAVSEDGSVTAKAETMDSVVLGSSTLVNGENLVFDDYESHRTTAIGGLLMGDSNGNGSINVFDLISIQNEILGNSLATGQPDCNSNGSVNVFDLICAQNIILGN